MKSKKALLVCAIVFSFLTILLVFLTIVFGFVKPYESENLVYYDVTVDDCSKTYSETNELVGYTIQLKETEAFLVVWLDDMEYDSLNLTNGQKITVGLIVDIYNFDADYSIPLSVYSLTCDGKDIVSIESYQQNFKKTIRMSQMGMSVFPVISLLISLLCYLRYFGKKNLKKHK